MTDSQHDAEALAAIRKANELLRLQSVTWSDVLEKPQVQPLPPGHQRAAQYRDTFRREALIPRLLAFPFWIFVELLAALAPDRPVNTRGPMVTYVFVLCMLLSIATWTGVGCSWSSSSTEHSGCSKCRLPEVCAPLHAPAAVSASSGPADGQAAGHDLADAKR